MLAADFSACLASVWWINKKKVLIVSRCQGLWGLQWKRLQQSTIHHQRFKCKQWSTLSSPSPGGKEGWGAESSEPYCWVKRDLTPRDPSWPALGYHTAVSATTQSERERVRERGTDRKRNRQQEWEWEGQRVCVCVCVCGVYMCVFLMQKTQISLDMTFCWTEAQRKINSLSCVISHINITFTLSGPFPHLFSRGNVTITPSVLLPHHLLFSNTVHHSPIFYWCNIYKLTGCFPPQAERRRSSFTGISKPTPLQTKSSYLQELEKRFPKVIILLGCIYLTTDAENAMVPSVWQCTGDRDTCFLLTELCVLQELKVRESMHSDIWNAWSKILSNFYFYLFFKSPLEYMHRAQRVLHGRNERRSANMSECVWVFKVLKCSHFC